MLEELARKNGGGGHSPQPVVRRSRSVFERIFSQKSFKGTTDDHHQERDVEIG